MHKSIDYQSFLNKEQIIYSFTIVKGIVARADAKEVNGFDCVGKFKRLICTW